MSAQSFVTELCILSLLDADETMHPCISRQKISPPFDSTAASIGEQHACDDYAAQQRGVAHGLQLVDLFRDKTDWQVVVTSVRFLHLVSAVVALAAVSCWLQWLLE